MFDAVVANFNFAVGRCSGWNESYIERWGGGVGGRGSL